MKIKTYKSGEDFLNKIYTGMHLEDVVMHTANKSDTPAEKIAKYIKRLELAHTLAKDNPHKMDILKKLYHNKYVIKELPENYIELQRRIAREEGHGDIEVTDNMREKMLEEIQSNQKRSLNMWIDYLSSNDVMYPMWFKNYAFQGMIKLNKFNKEKGTFGKRSSTTTEPFIELNREVLAQTYDVLNKMIKNNELTEEEVSAIKNGESFKKLYTYYLLKTGVRETSNETEGIWVKYEQGENYKPLWESLQGKNTGWCTAAEEMCKTQIEGGDFYVYYTKGEDGRYTEPRIAIRMEGQDKIGEVRGVAEEQNLEGSMVDIAEKKLDEFPDKEQYKKKVHDMKLLTQIDNKVKQGEELTKEELRFLYEIDEMTEGFGWGRDPRIMEIIRKRQIRVKKDLAIAFGCQEHEVATDYKDFDNNDIKVCGGYFDYTEFCELGYSIDKLKNIIAIYGDACFMGVTSAKCLENLTYIRGVADFRDLETAKGLEKLRFIGKLAFFQKLENPEGLKDLTYIYGEAFFPKLKTAEGLEKLKHIRESLTCSKEIKSKIREILEENKKKHKLAEIQNVVADVKETDLDSVMADLVEENIPDIQKDNEGEKYGKD